MTTSRRYRFFTVLVTFGLSLALAASVAAVAPSVPELRGEPLVMDLGFRPKALSRHRLTPIEIQIMGRVHPSKDSAPLLRKLVTDFDSRGALDLEGLAGCSKSRLLRAVSVSAARAMCRDSLIARGIAHVETSFPEGKVVRVPLTVFKGWQKGRRASLLVQGFLSSTESEVASIRVSPLKSGRYGTQAVSNIPELPGGGVLLDFSIRFGDLHSDSKDHSVLEATCPNGRLLAMAEPVVFSNGDEFHGQHFVSSCTPRSP
jgi:hypothetical protein